MLDSSQLNFLIPLCVLYYFCLRPLLYLPTIMTHANVFVQNARIPFIPNLNPKNVYQDGISG